jgi:hypothetical protein
MKKSMTAKQQEAKWAKEEKQRKEEFLVTIKQVSDLELFDIYCQVSISDDWDGAFSQEQAWKEEHAGVEMRKRLQGHANDRETANLQVSEGYAG